MRAGRRAGWAVAVVCLVGLGAGCSGSAKTPEAGHSAAEPAVSPALTATPAGRTIPIGTEPQGATYDATTGLVAVAVRSPDRLQLVDGATLTVRRSVALPGHARHLQLALPGGPVLVPAEDADEVVSVNLRTGATTAVRVGKSPHDAARTNDGRITAGDEFGASLTVISAQGTVERTITEIQQPGSIVAFGANVAVVDVKAYTVSTFDPATGKRTAVADAGAGPTHGVLIGSNKLAVADTRGSVIRLFSLSPLKEIGHLDLPGTPYGIAADVSTGLLWTTLTASNEVVGLDCTGEVPRQVARYPTVEQPDTITVAPGSKTIWVTGTKAGVLQKITR